MGSVEYSSDLKLRDVVKEVDNFDDDLTVYAAPEWTPDSAVILAREPDSGGIPAEAAKRGMQYFLEIFIVKEVLDGLQELDLEAKATRLIRYAVTDA